MASGDHEVKGFNDSRMPYELEIRQTRLDQYIGESEPKNVWDSYKTVYGSFEESKWVKSSDDYSNWSDLPYKFYTTNVSLITRSYRNNPYSDEITTD